MDTEYHAPVLLQEAIDGLDIRPDGIYVDATMGGGGHTRAILSRLSEKGRLVAFDQDEDAVRHAQEAAWRHDCRAGFTVVDQNFRFLKNYLRFYGALPVDGILADLGVSSHQFDVEERGFSIRGDGDLDMRMDRRQSLTAAAVLAGYEEEALARLFYRYGDLAQARKIAKAIVLRRAEKPIETAADLMALTGRWAEKGRENKFYATLFQALRMEVNQEEAVLMQFLQQAAEVLKPGGRLVVLSYHSVEDRLVKHFIRSGNADGVVEKDFYGNPLSPFRAVNRKVIQASEEELARNPRARSAKMRVAERLEAPLGAQADGKRI